MNVLTFVVVPSHSPVVQENPETMDMEEEVSKEEEDSLSLCFEGQPHNPLPVVWFWSAWLQARVLSLSYIGLQSALKRSCVCVCVCVCVGPMSLVI